MPTANHSPPLRLSLRAFPCLSGYFLSLALSLSLGSSVQRLHRGTLPEFSVSPYPRVWGLTAHILAVFLREILRIPLPLAPAPSPADPASLTKDTVSLNIDSTGASVR